MLPVGVAAFLVLAALQEGSYAPAAYSKLAVGLWWVVLLGLVLAVLPQAPLSRLGLVAGGLILGFGAFFVLSTGWAGNSERAFEGAVRALAYGGLFCVVVLLSRRGEARIWLNGVALGLAGIALIALATRAFPALESDEALARVLPSERGRLSHPIGYWNALAALMAVGVVMFAWLGAEAKTRGFRALAVAFIPLASLVIYLASSRGGVGAAIIGLLVLLAVGPSRLRILGVLVLGAAGTVPLILGAESQDRLISGATGPIAQDQGTELLLAILAVTVLTTLVALLVDPLYRRLSLPAVLRGPAVALAAIALVVGVVVADPAERWEEFKSPPPQTREDRSFNASHLASGGGGGRYQFWSAAVDAFEEEPIRGVGGGGYEAAWARNAPFAYSIQNAHSLYLETLAELGLIGGILLFGFFGVCVAAGLSGRRRRELGACLAVLAAALTSAAIDWTWQLPAVFAPAIIVCGLLAGPALRDESSPAGVTLPSGGWVLAARLTGAAAAIAVICASAVLLLASDRLEASREASVAGDYAASLQAARDATAIAPWSAAAYLQEGLLLEGLGAPREAIKAVREATERASGDWRPLLVLSRLQLRVGQGEAALRSLQGARALYPRLPLEPLPEALRD